MTLQGGEICFSSRRGGRFLGETTPSKIFRRTLIRRICLSVSLSLRYLSVGMSFSWDIFLLGCLSLGSLLLRSLSLRYLSVGISFYLDVSLEKGGREGGARKGKVRRAVR